MIELLHARFATAAMFYALVMSGWALVLAVRGRGLDGNFLGAVVVGELLLVLQALLGVFLTLRGAGMERLWLHVLYAALAVLIWPFLFTYTRSQPGRRESILFFAGTLFLWGLLLRAAEISAV